MKNEFKSIISMLLVMVMMLGVIFSVPVTASAQASDAEVSFTEPEIEISDDAVAVYEEPEIEKESKTRRDKDIADTSADKDVALVSAYQCGDWKYYVRTDYDDMSTADECPQVAEICGYTGSETTVTLPAYVDGYEVRFVSFNEFSVDECKQIVNITFPATVREVDGIYDLINLKSVTVSADNPYLVVNSDLLYAKDLYTKDMTELLYYPRTKTATTFTVPSTVNEVHIEDNTSLKKVNLSDAANRVNIYDCPNITSIHLPKNVAVFYSNNLPKLSSITVDAENINYSAKDGVLYNKKMTVIERYPEGKTDPTYTVPSTVKEISFSSKYLKKLIASDSATYVGLWNCPALTSLSAGKSTTGVECSGTPALTSLKLTDSVNGVYLYNCTSLTSLSLTKSVEGVRINSCPKLKTISVASANPIFSAKDGVLYNKAQTELKYYPSGKTSTSFTLPSKVKTATISDNKYLTKITFTSTTQTVKLSYLPKVTSLALTKNIKSLKVFSLSALKSITASSSNKYLYAKDGVLFSKDKKTLLLYPAGKTGSSYTVPDTVTTIADRAFAENKYIKTVTMNKNVVTISYGAFANCSSLSKAAMSKKLKTIGTLAFIDCPKLKTLSLPKSTSTIQPVAFGVSFEKDRYRYVPVSGFTTRGYKGTNVETYAKNNSLKFSDITPKSVKVSKSKVTLGVKETYNLDEVISPSNKVDVVKWSTSNKSVVTVGSTGVITAKKAGTATIKVTTSNKKTATCKVTVKKAPTKLSLNKKSATIKVKKQVNLNPKFYSGQYANKVTFKSSNTKIATVNSTGVVTGKKKGTVTITAKTYNGKKCTCKITVK